MRLTRLHYAHPTWKDVVDINIIHGEPLCSHGGTIEVVQMDITTSKRMSAAGLTLDVSKVTCGNCIRMLKGRMRL